MLVNEFTFLGKLVVISIFLVSREEMGGAQNGIRLQFVPKI